jgi:hypothetical protein
VQRLPDALTAFDFVVRLSWEDQDWSRGIAETASRLVFRVHRIHDNAAV